MLRPTRFSPAERHCNRSAVTVATSRSPRRPCPGCCSLGWQHPGRPHGVVERSHSGRTTWRTIHRASCAAPAPDRLAPTPARPPSAAGRPAGRATSASRGRRLLKRLKREIRNAGDMVVGVTAAAGSRQGGHWIEATSMALSFAERAAVVNPAGALGARQIPLKIRGGRRPEVNNAFFRARQCPAEARWPYLGDGRDARSAAMAGPVRARVGPAHARSSDSRSTASLPRTDFFPRAAK